MVKKSDHCASSSQEMNGCVNSFKEMKYICIEITKKKKELLEKYNKILDRVSKKLNELGFEEKYLKNKLKYYNKNNKFVWVSF